MFAENNLDQQELFEQSIFDVIKYSIPRLETIQITTKAPTELLKFESLLYTFIFNLSYNFDFTIMPLRFMDEFIQPFRID